MAIVIFDGRNSKDYHIVVEHPPGHDYPQRDYEFVHVPGRSGDLMIANHSFKNTTREYEIAVGDVDESYYILANRISEWLMPTIGYARLEDEYEPEYYRIAAIEDSFELDNIEFHAGRTRVAFNCKPQRYLKDGDRKRTITTRTLLKNPTSFESTPKIFIYGSGNGTIDINDQKVTITGIMNGMVIDSELKDIYAGTTNCNNKVTLPNGFPVFKQGDNDIQFSGGITSLEVIPRWWTI